MAVIYSPELIAAEQEFLQSVSFAGVVDAKCCAFNFTSACERVKFFGMDRQEIDELQSTGSIERVTIHSPSDGVILEKDVFEGQKYLRVRHCSKSLTCVTSGYLQMFLKSTCHS